MTNAPEQSKLDPDEKRTLVLTNAEIGNLMQFIDAGVRGNGLQAAEVALALATKLSTADPVDPTDKKA